MVVAQLTIGHRNYVGELTLRRFSLARFPTQARLHARKEERAQSMHMFTVVLL
jgi:hypothetical protein